MLNIKCFPPKKQNNLVKSNLFFILFLCISNLKSFNCQAGNQNAEFPEENAHDEDVFPPSLNNNQFFNNKLIFNNKNYQAGNFALNKNGDLILQFSEDNEISSSRLFYGLTKDGKKLFLHQTSFTEEMDVDVDEIRDEYGLYNLDEINSLNLFVTIKNDPK